MTKDTNFYKLKLFTALNRNSGHIEILIYNNEVCLIADFHSIDKGYHLENSFRRLYESNNRKEIHIAHYKDNPYTYAYVGGFIHPNEAQKKSIKECITSPYSRKKVPYFHKALLQVILFEQCTWYGNFNKKIIDARKYRREELLAEGRIKAPSDTQSKV